LDFALLTHKMRISDVPTVMDHFLRDHLLKACKVPRAYFTGKCREATPKMGMSRRSGLGTHGH